MSVTEWINLLLLGGMLGALGQGVRAVVGLKKLNDQAALDGRKVLPHRCDPLTNSSALAATDDSVSATQVEATWVPRIGQ